MPQPPSPGRERRRGVGVGAVVLLMLIALLLGVVIGLGTAQVLDDDTADTSGLPTTSGSGTVVSRAPDSVAGIAAGVLPGVVYIEVRSGGSRASGSGFVIREDGYLLTNNHVVAPGSGGRIDVVFSDGSRESAEIVGRTADYDLAVLRVDRDGLTPLVLGDSDAVAVGDPVVAVGAPLGLEGTVTSGIISALNRPVSAGDGNSTTFLNAIQTDAAINPGNSGGPLVNLAGEVIGINTAIAQTAGSAETGNIGLGFAIPSSQARRTADELIETGRATYPVIGVLLDSTYVGEGVRVAAQSQGGQEPITPGGPADAAGIRAGDVILRIDELPVTTPDELIVAIRARAPGESISLTVRRDGAEREVSVTLGEAVSE
jgi:putative serine protease PepD